MKKYFRKGEKLVLGNKLENSWYQKDGTEPGTYQTCKKHPAARQTNGKTQASQADRETTANIRGYHTEANVQTAHSAATHIVVVHTFVSTHKVETHTKHGQEVNDKYGEIYRMDQNANKCGDNMME